MNTKRPLVSVVMPCLNEEETIGICIENIQTVLARENIDGEIIVSDNGSTDNSALIAKQMGVKVVHERLRGYGNAYIKGFANAKGYYFVMGDADDTYDFKMIPIFLKKLHEGYDFVTGSRYLSKDGSRHITFLHRVIGNPLLTIMLNYLFEVKYTDVYCGFRAFSSDAYKRIKPISRGMEFNLELAINAWRAGLKITEIPIRLGPRKGESKLHTLKDGWRSLRMMLLYCPTKIFLWPGSFLLALGILTHLLILFGLIKYQGRQLSGVTGIFAIIFSVTGFQILILGLYAKAYSWSRRFNKSGAKPKILRNFKLEYGLMLGSAMVATSVLALGYNIIHWLMSDCMPLSHPERVALAATALIIGTGIIFSSLFISAMEQK